MLLCKSHQTIKNPASSAGLSHQEVVTLRVARLVLSSARKEPHYRVYFRPSLDGTLGRRFFYPTVMPCWLNNPQAICEYTRNTGFVKRSSKRFLRNCELLCKKQRKCANRARIHHSCAFRSRKHRPWRRRPATFYRVSPGANSRASPGQSKQHRML